MSGQFHISNFGNNITEVAMIALILLTLVFTSRAHNHGHSHRPSSSHNTFPTPTTTIPAPVRMFNPQPAAHEIKCPVPEQNNYFTGWPTNIWMYPIPQPSLVPSDSPSVKSRFPIITPIPAPVPTPVVPSSLAPTSKITSKPSIVVDVSSVPFLANTSLPSALPAHLPAPHRFSSAPSAVGASTLSPTNCTDTPAPSSAPSVAPIRPEPQTPSSTPTPSTISPSCSQAPIQRPSIQRTENPTTSVDNVRTEQPTIMPVTRITATPTAAETAPTFLVSSTQPSAAEISSAPSESARSSRPSNVQPPAPMKSMTPSYVSFSPSLADSSMTTTPSTSFPPFEVTYSVAPAAGETASPSIDIMPRTPVPTAVQPTVRMTEMPSARATNKEPSTAPTVRTGTTSVPSANPGHSSAPSGRTPQSSQSPVRSASPISSKPISTVTVQPSIKSTQSVEPTAPSTGAPHDTRSPSLRQSEAPIVLSRRPNSARTQSPTPKILSPVPTLFSTQTPTRTSTTESSTPIKMVASFTPSAALLPYPSRVQPLTVNPTLSPTAAYMLLNTTVNAVLANMTTSNAELSQLERKCIEDGILASLVSLLSIIHTVRVDARQAQVVSMHTLSTSDSWVLAVIITLNTTRNDLLSNISTLQLAFNASIYSGLLQYNTRAAALAATPPVTSMIMVVFCAEEDQTRCLAGVIPAVPAADSKISACKQESTEWNALYNSPGIIPWYLVWTMVLMTGWIIIAAWATTNIQWRTIYVTAAFCAYARVVYFALLLVHHFSHYSYSERLSLACIEFAYLDTNNNDQFYLAWTIIVTRSLFYPLLLLLGCQLVRNYWTCRDTRDTLYPMLAILVALCAMSLSVSYVVLLIAHAEPFKHGLTKRTAAVAVIGAVWAVQLLCGVLLLAQGVRLWIGCLTHTRARRLSDVYEDPHSSAVADASFKHSSIESNSTYRDLHRSSVQYLNPHEAIATENAFERSAAAHMRVVIAILIVSAALVIVTIISQALTTAIAAFVLYSVLARVTEILLVIAILHKSIDMRVFLHVQDDHGYIPEHSILSSTHDYDIPHGNNATNAPPLPCRQLPRFRSLGPQQGINTSNAHKSNRNEALPSCSDLTEQSNIDRTVWNKKWPWVATPCNDIAVQVAEHVHINDSAIMHSQPLQVAAGDSGSEDSTDSSGTYFV